VAGLLGIVHYGDIRNAHTLDAARSPYFAILNSDAETIDRCFDLGWAKLLVTLTWDTGNTDIDLYTIDPAGDYSAYFHKGTADGGQLDYDDTDGFGPEHWTLLSGQTVRWGQDYRVRVHYFSDHGQAGVATSYTVTVVLYEGTSRSQTRTYHGVLQNPNSGNNRPDGTGADLADVCIITPVNAAGSAARAESTPDPSGVPRITVPIPSEYLRSQQKMADELMRR
jgi:hypothetical protein